MDIQVLTMEDIMEKERKAKEEVEVMTSSFKLFIEMSPSIGGQLRRRTSQSEHETIIGNQKEKC